MLQSLEITNIALIDHIVVNFNKGMNCLTGETGAGKSIIIDSIGCILGDRTSRDLIRTGTDSAMVKGLFCLDSCLSSNPEFSSFLSENNLEIQKDSFEISREFDKNGKNTCKFNGKNIPLSLLKAIGTFLIDVHGQHDNQSLLRTETHISLLDLFAGKEMGEILNEYNACRLSCIAKQNEIRKLTGDPSERARKIDLLRYQADEISAAKLKPGEEEILEESHRLLANSEKISDSINKAHGILSNGNGSVLDNLGDAVSALKNVSKYSAFLDELYHRTEDSFYALQDISSDLRHELDNVTFAPDELDRIDSRIDAINSLKRKYGNTIDEILAFGAKAEETARFLESSEEFILKTEKEIKEIHVKMKSLCEKIHDYRVTAAEKLEKSVVAELQDLEMPGAIFSVDICFDGSEEPTFTNTGLDSVEFLMSANRGEPLKPLARVASGGELSRIMLAIKKIFAEVDLIPTMIFDEIDIGISGKTASALGDKLRLLASSHQVICVTHLAQIAARAHENLIVSKSFNGENTTTTVLVPNKQERINEIARLLDGDSLTEVTYKHAEEMLGKFN